MKLVLTFLTLLSFSAQADVVGDWIQHAIFSGDNHIGYQQREYKTGRSNETVTLETLTADTSGNVMDSQTEEVRREDAYTREFAQALLANCAAFGGVRESLDLSGTNYDTCKMPVNSDIISAFVPEKYQKGNGVAWFGEVPVNGIVALALGDLTLIYNGSNW